MPSPDARKGPKNSNALQYLRTLKLVKKMKLTSEDRLNVSRKLFNLSRNRVESLKKNQYVKRFTPIAKPADDSWITSGKLGSCEAVLVFRTNILNPRVRTLSQKTSEPDENGSSPFECDNINDNCNSIYGDTIPTNSSLPSTSRSACNTPLLTERAEFTKLNCKLRSKISSHNKASSLDKTCRSDKENEIKNNIPTHINDSLNNSLSSSENSITSEADEVQESCKEALEANLVYNSNINHNEVAEEGELDSDTGSGEDMDNSSVDSENCPYASNMPAVQLKLSYKFMQTETKLLRKVFVRHGLTEVTGNEHFSILWTGVHMKPDILRNLAPYQRVNHFPRSYELTRKDRLYKNIERMQHLRGYKHFDIVPQSFILPLEFKDLVTLHNKNRGPWIVKPAASSRGRGIFIVNTPDQIPQDEQILVSKYISNPLCIDGHKCDLRVYVLVTSFDPLIIYLYEEGLVRLATVKYDRKADNLWNPCMHLCNYSINKYHSDYIKSSDAHEEDVGHKWTLSALLRHLRSQGCNTDQLMANIEDIIIKSVFACAQTIISACRMFVPNGNNCFELYGFDILIDDTLKPWLLEINLSPSMGVDSPLDARVKACLVVDLLTCIGIPAFSPTMRANYDSKWTRFRNINYTRRTNSADTNGTGSSQSRKGSQGQQSSFPLTIEEQRIIRNARLQNARRGGFVRIYPTEDSMNRYGMFLDPTTGIPLSTSNIQGAIAFSMILPHNYNNVLYNHLYGKESRSNGMYEGNLFNERMQQYERALVTASLVQFETKPVGPKCIEEGKRLRKKILKLIDNGSEMTQLQARQSFALYLETVLSRLTQEPRDYHEKLILKFLNRIGGSIKAPVFFRNPQNLRNINKAQSAMVAKLLSDFLEQYTRETEAYVDTFDHYGMIPTGCFSEFLSQAHEADLEAVLTFHTNVTNSMPYLYNRFGLSVPRTPPIPSGLYGFLRALPAMVQNGAAGRDFNKNEGYYKSMEKEVNESKCEKSNRKSN